MLQPRRGIRLPKQCIGLCPDALLLGYALAPIKSRKQLVRLRLAILHATRRSAADVCDTSSRHAAAPRVNSLLALSVGRSKFIQR